MTVRDFAWFQAVEQDVLVSEGEAKCMFSVDIRCVLKLASSIVPPLWIRGI